MMPARIPVRQRLLSHRRIDGECWIWTGYTNPRRGGYGTINIKGVPDYVHRVAYRLWIGPIPDGLHIDHLCRRPPCFNPAHLEAVTPAENAWRGMAPLIVQSRSGVCKRGHAMTPENTYMRPDGHGRGQCRKCIKIRSRRLQVKRKTDRYRRRRRTRRTKQGAAP